MKDLLQAIGALIAVAVVSAAISLAVFKIEGGGFSDSPIPVPEDTVVVDGPREVVVGEMVRLTAEGKLVKWQCFPMNPDCQVFGEKGEQFAISFRKPGEYLIVFAVYNRGELEIRHFDIVVTGKKPDPDEPEDPEDPIVTSQPLTQDVLLWCTDAEVDKELAVSLSKNFSKVYQEIEAGELTSPDEVITRTAELNSSLDLSSAEEVLGKIQAYLINASDIGSLGSMDSHALVWAAISEGFGKYADRD